MSSEVSNKTNSFKDNDFLGITGLSIEHFTMNVIVYYINHLIHSLFFVSDKKLPKVWPSKGEIVFDKVFLSYSSDEPPVLKNVNFLIRTAEKVKLFSFYPLSYK